MNRNRIPAAPAIWLARGVLEQTVRNHVKRRSIADLDDGVRGRRDLAAESQDDISRLDFERDLRSGLVEAELISGPVLECALLLEISYPAKKIFHLTRIGAAGPRLREHPLGALISGVSAVSGVSNRARSFEPQPLLTRRKYDRPNRIRLKSNQLLA